LRAVEVIVFAFKAILLFSAFVFAVKLITLRAGFSAYIVTAP
jgi:hypothetical protein